MKTEKPVKAEKPEKTKPETQVKVEKPEKVKPEKPVKAEKPEKQKPEKQVKVGKEKPEKQAKATAGRGSVQKTRNGDRIYRGKDNTSATIHNGKPIQVQRGSTVIRRPGGGPRTVIAQRPGHQVVVARGAARGYVQHPVAGRRNYIQRTYYRNHMAYVRAYRQFRYHGVILNVYAPMRYYPVGFYGWASDAWATPIGYTWGWVGQPWFGFYGPYFRPWGGYAGPSYWLTDYLIAETLQEAFQAREEADAQAAAEPDQSAESAAPLSDDVKQMIEAEVRRQLAEEQEEAGGGEEKESVPPSLAESGAHLFVANNNLEVENVATGETCVIGEGDAIQMNGRLPESGGDVSVLVRASKGSDCSVNTTVSVPLPDLIEMHNSMRETLDRGLEALRAATWKSLLKR